jgi:hypothetical protein
MKSKADLHIHTYYSDGLDSPEQIVRSAAIKDLAVIAICDHNRIKGAQKAQEFAQSHTYIGVEVIVGEEITTLNGHILGLFLKERIKPGLTAEETIEKIHAQGGLAIVPHPFHFYIGKKRGNVSAGKLMDTLNIDGVEVICNSSIASWWANMKAALKNASSMRTAIGSSDAHDAHFIGHGYTLFPGKTAADLRTAIENRKCTAHYHFWSIKDLWRSMHTGLQNLAKYYFDAGIEAE